MKILTFCSQSGSGNRLRDEEGGSGCKSSNYNGLQSGSAGFRAGEAALDVAEDSQGEQSDGCGPYQGLARAVENHVGRQGNEASGDIRPSDGQGTLQGALGVGFFQAKLKAHHEVDPLFWLFGERFDDWLGFVAGEAVVGEDLLDFARFFVGNLFDLACLAQALAFVVFGIGAGGEVSAQTHRDGACSDFGQAGDDDDTAVVDCAGDAGSEGEGNSEAVGHADDHIADDVARGEVALNVRCLRHAPPVRDATSDTQARVLRL